MIQQCPSCNNQYQIPIESLPRQGVQIQCPHCGHRHVVKAKIEATIEETAAHSIESNDLNGALNLQASSNDFTQVQSDTELGSATFIPGPDVAPDMQTIFSTPESKGADTGQAYALATESFSFSGESEARLEREKRQVEAGPKEKQVSTAGPVTTHESIARANDPLPDIDIPTQEEPLAVQTRTTPQNQPLLPKPTHTDFEMKPDETGHRRVPSSSTSRRGARAKLLKYGVSVMVIGGAAYFAKPYAEGWWQKIEHTRHEEEKNTTEEGKHIFHDQAAAWKVQTSQKGISEEKALELVSKLVPTANFSEGAQSEIQNAEEALRASVAHNPENMALVGEHVATSLLAQNHQEVSVADKEGSSPPSTAAELELPEALRNELDYLMSSRETNALPCQVAVERLRYRAPSQAKVREAIASLSNTNSLCNKLALYEGLKARSPAVSDKVDTMLKKAPKDLTLLMIAGEAARRQGDFAKAQSLSERSEAISKQSEDPYTLFKTRLHINLNNFDRARAILVHALTQTQYIGVDELSLLRHLDTHLLSSPKRSAKILNTLKAKVRDGDVESQLIIAAMQLDSGNIAASKKILEQTPETGSVLHEALTFSIDFHQKRYGDAFDSAKRLARLSGEDESLHFEAARIAALAGVSALNANRIDEATQAFRSSLNNDPTQILSILGILTLAIEENNYESVSDVVAGLRFTDLTRWREHAIEGQLPLHEKQALASLQRRLNPTKTPRQNKKSSRRKRPTSKIQRYYKAIARALLALHAQDWRSAEAHAVAASKNKRRHEIASLLALFASGQREDAKKMRSHLKVFKRSKGRKAPLVTWAHTKIDLIAKRPKSALKGAEEMVRHDEYFAPAQWVIADASLALGDVDKEIAALKRLRELRPASSRVTERLAKVQRRKRHEN